MNKCKNCGIEIKKNRVYCSLTCRNIYVNKNLRDYSKNSDAVRKKHKNIYLENPKFCKFCGKKLSYDKKRNDFCDSSCSASYSNKHRDKFIISEKGMINLRKSIKYASKFNTRRNSAIEKNKEKYLKNPKYCNECGNEIEYRFRYKKFCNRKCQHKYQRKHLNDYQKYYRNCQFKFALNEYPNEFDFSLIEKHGWYKAKNHGDNLNGVSRDHMFSIKEGFENNVDSNLISHPANCRLMLHTKNKRKHTKCSITIEELKKKIIEWDKKYAEFV